MKKYLFSMAIILSAVFVNAQDSAKTEKTLEFGVGIGPGIIVTGGSDVASIGGILQAENHFSPQFSGFVSAEYSLLFSTGGGSGTLGFIPIEAGPRFYFNKDFFLGAGVGYAILTGEGESVGAFNYHPQIGYNGKRMQAVLGYNAMKKEGTLGFLDLKIIFKL